MRSRRASTSPASSPARPHAGGGDHHRRGARPRQRPPGTGRSGAHRRLSASGRRTRSPTSPVTTPSAAGGQPMRFLVLATLGSGGFGTVERAIDMATGEQVAIKRLRADRGRSGAARALIDTTVRREIETARKVPPRFAARTRYLNVDRNRRTGARPGFRRRPDAAQGPQGRHRRSRQAPRPLPPSSPAASPRCTSTRSPIATSSRTTSSCATAASRCSSTSAWRR